METTNQIVKKEDAPITKIRNLLENKRADLQMAIPQHLTVDRLIRVALTACNKTPKLMECTPQSLLSCIMDCASLGLEPDSVLGRAYLIPYKDKATLIIGYKGLADLAYRTGMVESLDAFVVHTNDKFSLKMGLNPDIQHEPSIENPGEFMGVYAVARLKGSSLPKFCYMTKKEVESIRKRSRASNEGPWATDYEEMAKKTAIRRLAKLLPMSSEFADALTKDQEYDFDSAPALVAKKPIFPTKEVKVSVVPEPVEEPAKEENKPVESEKKSEKKEPVSKETKTSRFQKLLKEQGIDEAKALNWLGESGVASFEDCPDDLIKMIFSQPKQFKKTVEEA